MDTRERIFELLDESELDQNEFADRLGISKHIVSKWRNTDLGSFKKYLPQIAEVLNTTVEYLLTGNGPKHRESPAQPVFISREAQAVAVAYDQADEKSKSIVRLTLNVDAAGPSEPASEPTEEAM